MTPNWKLTVRSILLLAVTFLTAWAAADYSVEKAALGGAIIVLFQAALEILGPTSDAGVKWEGGKP